ncbi:DNA-directed RNA polymerase subunit beta [Nocardia beijingensis]|uniref:DNA-directed RNA polymerase subunit beta n=1 Tax=Nocardia beijingensis TaxID=95162 RepID=UPI0018963A34|nr:DNA-directed RNA polymerase subunit beta [Nocardia beijingensis]MBF6463753.1 DNA-directed RNA polymerase subunit beta [Nocardia beijingensis]
MSEPCLPAADTPVSRCLFYRRCGLAAAVQPELGRIVVPAGRVGAITMPARLGQEVKALMQVRRCALGPIISHPRSGRWTYLVRPDLPDEVGLFAELFRSNVSVARYGAQIALPSPADRSPSFRVWVEPPRDTFRPSGSVVVAAIRLRAGRRG